MPQSQSQPPTIQDTSAEARSELCYEFKRGKEIIKRTTAIYPFQSNMLVDDGSLLSALFQANNKGKPINEETAWDTEKNDRSKNTVDVAQKLGWSLRTGSNITPLEDSFALIADGNGHVRWWSKKEGPDGSIVSKSGTHYPEEPERDDLPETDGTKVPQ
jgi:hypothetical protein